MLFPKMLYRDGAALPEHGVDYVIVADAEEQEIALSDGWRETIEAIEAPRRGRPRKVAE